MNKIDKRIDKVALIALNFYDAASDLRNPFDATRHMTKNKKLLKDGQNLGVKMIQDDLKRRTADLKGRILNVDEFLNKLGI